MPEMDGFQVVDALKDREEWRDIPIVVVTAKDLTEHDRGRLQGAVETIIQKGAHSRQELLNEVKRLANSYVSPTRS